MTTRRTEGVVELLNDGGAGLELAHLMGGGVTLVAGVVLDSLEFC